MTIKGADQETGATQAQVSIKQTSIDGVQRVPKTYDSSAHEFESQAISDALKDELNAYFNSNGTVKPNQNSGDQQSEQQTKAGKGNQSEPLSKAKRAELEKQVASRLGFDDDQSVGEVEEKETEEQLDDSQDSDSEAEVEAKDSETGKEENTSKTEDESSDKSKPDKTGIQRKIDRLTWKAKTAEEKSDKEAMAHLRTQKQLEIALKEHKHLLSVIEAIKKDPKQAALLEDPREVKLRNREYVSEFQEFNSGIQSKIEAEKQKAIREYQQQQQLLDWQREAEELAQKHDLVSAEEIMTIGAVQFNKSYAEIAKELQDKREKKMSEKQVAKTKGKAPKTAANVGTSVNDQFFDDDADGMRAWLRARKG